MPEILWLPPSEISRMETSEISRMERDGNGNMEINVRTIRRSPDFAEQNRTKRILRKYIIQQPIVFLSYCKMYFSDCLVCVFLWLCTVSESRVDLNGWQWTLFWYFLHFSKFGFGTFWYFLCTIGSRVDWNGWRRPLGCGINNNKLQWTGSNGGGFKFQEEIILKKTEERKYSFSLKDLKYYSNLYLFVFIPWNLSHQNWKCCQLYHVRYKDKFGGEFIVTTLFHLHWKLEHGGRIRGSSSYLHRLA